MKRLPLIIAFALAALAFSMLCGVGTQFVRLPSTLLWVIGVASAAVAGNEILGKPVPFLRWSFLRMLLGMRRLLTEWQVGDGREEKVAQFVTKRARRGDVDDVIRVIDEFGHHHSYLINVGDEKGLILDGAVERAKPKRVLEVGTYVGYSALRIARQLGPDGHVYSLEFNPSNAAVARRIIEHAGMSHRISVIVGYLGDGGAAIQQLTDVCGFGPANLDFVFLDHDKDVYVSDLALLDESGWLHTGSVVLADNVGFPGAPEYRAYMNENQGKRWNTEEHKTHVEYQSLLKDLVLESTLLA